MNKIWWRIIASQLYVLCIRYHCDFNRLFPKNVSNNKPWNTKSVFMPKRVLNRKKIIEYLSSDSLEIQFRPNRIIRRVNLVINMFLSLFEICAMLCRVSTSKISWTVQTKERNASERTKMLSKLIDTSIWLSNVSHSIYWVEWNHWIFAMWLPMAHSHHIIFSACSVSVIRKETMSGGWMVEPPHSVYNN